MEVLNDELEAGRIEEGKPMDLVSLVPKNCPAYKVRLLLSASSCWCFSPTVMPRTGTPFSFSIFCLLSSPSQEEIAFFEFLDAELKKIDEFFIHQERWFVDHCNAIVRQFNSMVQDIEDEDRILDQPPHIFPSNDSIRQRRPRHVSEMELGRTDTPSPDTDESKEEPSEIRQQGPLEIESAPAPKPWELSYSSTWGSLFGSTFAFGRRRSGSMSGSPGGTRFKMGTYRERKALKISTKEIYRGLDLLRVSSCSVLSAWESLSL